MRPRRGELIAAARAGDGERLRTLLAAGADVDEVQAGSLLFGGHIVAVRGCTPLLAAVGEGHTAAARLLVAAGADARRAGEGGVTALHLAAFLDRADLVRPLVEAGADLEARADGDTPLLTAIALQRHATARELVRAGADVHAVDRGLRETPLLRLVGLALPPAGLRLVDALLAAGADPGATNLAGEGVLHRAARGAPRVVRRLLRAGADVHALDRARRTPLSHAARSAPCARLLLAAGAAPDPVDGFGQRPLHAAAAAGDLAVVRLLLRAGADPDREDQDGETPLSVARDDATRAALRKAGAAACPPPSPPAPEPWPLHAAAGRGDDRAVRARLEAGAEVDARDDEGRTPLHHACEAGRARVVRRLLAAGADVRARTEEKDEPLLVAARHGHAPVVALLEAAGAAHPLAPRLREVLALPARLQRGPHAAAVRALARRLGRTPLRVPRHLRGGAFFDLRPRKAGGVEAHRALAAELGRRVAELGPTFLARGCLLLHVPWLSGDLLALLPTTDPLAAVAWLGPRPRGLVAMLELLRDLPGAWTLVGCAHDQLRVRVDRRPRDPLAFVKQLARSRPDELGLVLPDGSVDLGTAKEVAAGLRAGSVVRLWWD